IKVNKFHRKHWIKLGVQLCKLYLNKKNNQSDLTNLSYNKVSSIYDHTWTNHMQVFSKDMLDGLSFPIDGTGLDLACGTGYITGLMAEKINGDVTGVDISKGMLKVANQKFGIRCKFVCSDVLEYLNKQPSENVDVVTCAWGLGYSKPFQVLKEINRVLKDHGKVGVIENTLLTLPEITWAGILSIAEKPEILDNYPQFRFPLSIYGLIIKMWLSGFHIQESWKGSITYYEQSGKELVQRLRNTSGVAGYEYAINKNFREEYFQRMTSILDYRYRKKQVIPINHRYVGAIGIN
ncbi:MAG: methyltransferase domain-containing protein, partial [Thermoplasmatales archaeon]|nr:methyltransferase domain-containing protein [Thermoplasmatales archaeon]